MDDIVSTKDARKGDQQAANADETLRARGGASRANARSVMQRRGIQSVETGLHVLAALAACGGPVPLSAVAQRAGVSPSQAHRYLSTGFTHEIAMVDQPTSMNAL